MSNVSNPTIAVDVFPCKVRYGSKIVDFDAWDTAGTEKFKCLLPLYFRGAAVAILVYSQDDPESFSEVQRWFGVLTNEHQITNIIVVSNKIDLPEVVPFQTAKAWCKENKLRVIRTSALTGANIFNLFLSIAERLVEISPTVYAIVDITENSRRRIFNCV